MLQCALQYSTDAARVRATKNVSKARCKETRGEHTSTCGELVGEETRADAMPSDVDLGNAKPLAECVTWGVVAGTVASSAYADAMVFLAQSAHVVGFRCIVVQPFENMTSSNGFQRKNLTYVRSLTLPAASLIPRNMWCNASAVTNIYTSHFSLQRHGWRRSHFYRTRLWRSILEHGYDMLSVDLDWTFVDLRLQPLQPPGSLVPMLRAVRTMNNETVDVVSIHDGQARMLLNVGAIFVRSTTATVTLARRVENRSFGAWEQALFNEELNFGADDISCCHVAHDVPCDLQIFMRPRDEIHVQGHEKRHIRKRIFIEGAAQCSEDLPPTALPPARTRYYWRHQLPTDSVGKFSGLGWRQKGHYNELDGKRPSGRCTSLKNVCQCQALRYSPDHTPDDALRLRNPERLARYLQLKGKDLTVNSSAFHEAMRLGWPPRGNPTYDPSKPVLLRDWLKPFVGKVDWALIMKAGNATSRDLETRSYT